MPELPDGPWLLGVFGQHQALAAFADLPELAEDLAGAAQNRAIGRDAMRAIVADYVAKNGRAAAKMGPEEFQRGLGGYIANGKRSITPAGLGPQDPDVREALTTFGEAWAKANPNLERVHDQRDAEHAATCVALVRQAAADIGGDSTWQGVWRKVVRFYLADRERFVVDASHPLRLLPGRLSNYPLPKRASPPSPRPEEPPQKLDRRMVVKGATELLAALGGAAIGAGGG